MRAELRFLHSPDVDDLRSYESHEAPFSVFIEAIIGVEGGSGEESFGFVVCNPAWLDLSLSGEQSYFWSRARLVMNRYDFKRIEAAVRDLCAGAEAEDWISVARLLSRHTLWEFEDYKPAPDQRPVQEPKASRDST